MWGAMLVSKSSCIQSRDHAGKLVPVYSVHGAFHMWGAMQVSKSSCIQSKEHAGPTQFCPISDFKRLLSDIGYRLKYGTLIPSFRISIIRYRVTPILEAAELSDIENYLLSG